MYPRIVLILAGFMLILAGCDSGRPPTNTSAEKPSPSTAAGAVHAEACAPCHGKDGVPTVPGVPFIGGQHADYLVDAMQAYRQGGRKSDVMRTVLGLYTPEQMAAAAAYYADRTAPWKGAGRDMADQATKRAVADPRAVAVGKALSAPCAACHGQAGVNPRATYPSPAGLPEAYIRDALHAYFKGGRAHPYMDMFKTALNETEIAQLAAYYASLTPVRSTLPVKGDPAAGKARSGICAGCHGADGNSLNPNIPSLTGQSSEYLAKAIGDYRAGRRRHAVMRGAVTGLGNADIANLAAYYASQAVVRAGADKASTGGDPLAEGAHYAATCDGCHGAGGSSRTTGMPSLAGLAHPYLTKATREYRDGARAHPLMRDIVSHLSDLDIEKIALHYAIQPLAPAKAKIDGGAARAAELSAGCDGCHGKQGNSADAKAPSLAGQEPTYLVQAMTAYASGARQFPAMQDAVKALKKDELRLLAEHYARQTRQPPNTRLPEKAASIATRCNRCHGVNGLGGKRDQPRLAGQSEGFLVKALLEYQAGSRKHSAMNAMSEVLNLVEIRDLAAHYSRL